MRLPRPSSAAFALVLGQLLLLWTAPSLARPVAAERSLKDVLSGLDLPSLGTIIDSAIDTLEALIKTLKSGQSVQNGLVDMMKLNATTVNGTVSAAAVNGSTTACPDLAVIFARGTSEPGNVGFLSGPPFFMALQNYMNGTRNIAVQGVDYPASVKGFAVGGDPFAAATMARLAAETMDRCPSTKVVLSGYSQGAQVVHLAAEQMAAAAPATGNTTATPATPATPAAAPANTTTPATGGNNKDGDDDENDGDDDKNKGGDHENEGPEEGEGRNIAGFNATSAVQVAGTAGRISSVVLFGDPRNGSAVAGVDPGRVFTACHAGDNICKGGDLVLPAHLNYSGDAPAAAMFVMQRSALGMSSSDAVMQGMGNVPTMQNPTPAPSTNALGRRLIAWLW